MISAHRPYEGVPRLMSMILMLAVLAAMFYQARKPSTWQWLAGNEPPAAGEASQTAPGDSIVEETVVPGPTDEDEFESAESRTLFEAVADRAPISPTDMPAYWRCMKWARAQPLAALEIRAQKNVRYGQLWEQPDEYRGKLIGLRLHVRRILDYEAPQNSAGVDRVYEIWGATEESKSHPYVVLVSGLPPGMAPGSDLKGDAVFAGYFLKLLSYSDALATHRAAPLLIGRIQPVAAPARRSTGNGSSLVFWTACGALVLVLALRMWMRFRPSRKLKPEPEAPADEAFLTDWYSKNSDSPEDESPPDRA
jgi:hypothetical protein